MMSVRDTKIRDRVAVGAPDTGHQPAFDDAWTEVEIPDIINSRLDPSPRERTYRTKYAPPEQRRGKSQSELKYRKPPEKSDTDWEFVFGFIFFTLHGWIAIGMGILWLVQYILD